MNGVHSLRAWIIDSENLQLSRNLPTKHAFGSTLRTYEIAVGVNDPDLLYVMNIKRQKIKNFVRVSVQQHSQKVQFSSKMQLKKPLKTEDEFWLSQPDRISLYVQS